MKRFEGVETCD